MAPAAEGAGPLQQKQQCPSSSFLSSAFTEFEVTFDRPEDEREWESKHGEQLAIRLRRTGNYLTCFLVLTALFASFSDNQSVAYKSATVSYSKETKEWAKTRLGVCHIILIGIFWAVCNYARFLEPNTRFSRLRVLVPASAMVLGAFAILNQALFFD